MNTRIVCRFAAFLAATMTHASMSACTLAPTNPENAGIADASRYDIVYTIEIEADDKTATARIGVSGGRRRLTELSFTIDNERHSGFKGDGKVRKKDGRLVWEPPRAGGELTYRVRIPQQRRNGAYDARHTGKWALFRVGDVFPPMATKATGGAVSQARLELDLPPDWSALTSYLSGDNKLSFPFDNPERRFDRPAGWVLVGAIGVRRGLIAETRVAIGAPIGENVHRMDIMAYLNWTLPEVRRIFPTLDPRLVIVSAGDPMWRGGLSGPGSLYMHADRPLISENGTSTLLHELVHVAMGVSGKQHDDWLVEGLAEYYSIKILHTTGTLSIRRRDLALQDLSEWGKGVDDLFVSRASGPVTARATTLLADLDAYLAQETRGKVSLDEVVVHLIEEQQPYSYTALCIAVNRFVDAPVPVLLPDNVPGAGDVAVCQSK